MKFDELISLAKSAKSCGNTDIAIDRLIEALEQMRPRRITPEEFGRVWERWRRGESVEKIASGTGYTVARVATITRKCKRLYPHDLASYRERTGVQS
jgi:hypothetical protein